eukprot:CAMPEP_0171739396 /NCGR_PEP_ID=MMETSP0991-20121206/34220_1 /TAXON_ID=483369 /ORGANISM="non described non described, Strain CCMP2098" /LENGTH=482 /DNA_ID=CAMNT_0012337029 /DNA_START=276 /DNA_END=1723 /DNA_ORIENTATION=+
MATSISSTSQLAKNMVPTDSELFSSASPFSLSSCTENLLVSEARAERLDQELIQKTKELGHKTKELDRTSLEADGKSAVLIPAAAAERLPVVWGKNSDKGSIGNIDGDQVDDITSTGVPQQFRLNSEKAHDLVSGRRMLTTTVATRAELTSALTNNSVIELAADILMNPVGIEGADPILMNSVEIEGLTGVVIDGNGFKLDGNNSVRCLGVIDSALTINNIAITRGFKSKDTGGGLFIVNSVVALFRCIITENSAHAGGGIAIDNSDVRMTWCTITLNSALTSVGGGVGVKSGTLRLVGCTFSGNLALGNGDDVYRDGGSVDVKSLCAPNSASAGDCHGCSGPADLSNTASCTACTDLTPFACCGATACSYWAPVCPPDFCSDPTFAAYGTPYSIKKTHPAAHAAPLSASNSTSNQQPLAASDTCANDVLRRRVLSQRSSQYFFMCPVPSGQVHQYVSCPISNKVPGVCGWYLRKGAGGDPV